MFIPKEFSEKDQSTIVAFVAENPLGTLVFSNPVLQACHLPFIISEESDKIVLESHIAKANSQSDFQHQQNVLVIFTGAKGYISSKVYEKPNAPTYNYQAVHLHGTIQKLTTEQLHQHLNKLVETFEKERQQKFDIQQLPSAMYQAYVNEIVGIRIEISKIEAAYKLSQNRNEKDFHAIINDLESNPKNEALIKAMKKTRD